VTSSSCSPVDDAWRAAHRRASICGCARPSCPPRSVPFTPPRDPYLFRQLPSSSVIVIVRLHRSFVLFTRPCNFSYFLPLRRRYAFPPRLNLSLLKMTRKVEKPARFRHAFSGSITGAAGLLVCVFLLNDLRFLPFSLFSRVLVFWVRTPWTAHLRDMLKPPPSFFFSRESWPVIVVGPNPRVVPRKAWLVNSPEYSVFSGDVGSIPHNVEPFLGADGEPHPPRAGSIPPWTQSASGRFPYACV